MPLSLQTQQKLASADPASVRSSLASLAPHWKTKAWLAAQNVYRNDPIIRIQADIQSPQNIAHSDLSQYISASTIVHCVDGWSFLGRAFNAELAGDPEASRHLGYYAELRAAMSLLAVEGIGVFNRKHAVVQLNGNCELFSAGGTHEFVWDALQHWAGSNAGTSTLLSVIRPGGVVLADWIQHFGGGANFLASTWLQQWGLDISRLVNDREARNVASYRPTDFTSPGANLVRQTLANINTLWQACEPGSTDSGFPNMDRQLLRESLKVIWSKLPQASQAQAPQFFRQLIKQMLKNITPPELSEPQWERLLTGRNTVAQRQILLDAAGTVGPDHKDHSKQVLARALLLLRVATGACQLLVESLPGSPRDDLKFWWSSLGVARGLWSGKAKPDHFADLWSDVDQAIKGIGDWSKLQKGKIFRSAVWRDKAAPVATLCSVERTALWGLGL